MEKHKLNRTLKPIERNQANLEAEEGETVLTNLQGEGIPEFYTVEGKRHSKGGTPLFLPDDSFFFSRDDSMRISDKGILDEFDMKETKKGYTPAEISKKYDLNKYREILADPDTTKLENHTAELMIMNYMQKLGELAVAQESQKGFENGIPMVAMPFLESNNIDPTSFLQEDQQDIQIPAFKFGGEKKPLIKYQPGGPTKTYTLDQLPKDRTKFPLFESQQKADEWLNSGASEGKSAIVKVGENQYKVYNTQKRQSKTYTANSYDERYGTINDYGDSTNQYYNLADYLSNNDYEKGKKIYEIWRNKQFKTKSKDANGKIVESDYNIDKDFFEKLYEENPETYNSAADAFVTYFLNGQDIRYNYKKTHKDEWKDWSDANSEISKSNSSSSKFYLNSDAHTNQFMNETNITQDEIKLLQSIDLAMNDYATTGNGKSDGLSSYSTNKSDSNSDAGVGKSTGSGYDDISGVDGKTGERFLDINFQIKNPEYEFIESDWTPDEKKDIEYDPMSKGVKRPFVADLPSGMQALNAIRQRYDLKEYTPWEAPTERIEINPEYINNYADISDLLSLASTTSNGQGVSADSSTNRMNSAAMAAQIAGEEVKSDMNVNNTNVGVANDFKEKQATLDSAFNKENAKRNTRLHNNWMKLKQQFDNAKNALIKNAVDSTVSHIRKSVDNYNRGTDNFYFGPYGEINYAGDVDLKHNASQDAQAFIASKTKDLMQYMPYKDAHDAAIKEFKAVNGINDGFDINSLLQATGVRVG